MVHRIIPIKHLEYGDGSALPFHLKMWSDSSYMIYYQRAKCIYYSIWCFQSFILFETISAIKKHLHSVMFKALFYGLIASWSNGDAVIDAQNLECGQLVLIWYIIKDQNANVTVFGVFNHLFSHEIFNYY